MVSAFWNDIQTSISFSCAITAEFTRNAIVLARMQAQIGDGVTFSPREVFIATWNRVGRYSSDYSVENTFQIVLGYSATETYAIFLYDAMEVSFFVHIPSEITALALKLLYKHHYLIAGCLKIIIIHVNGSVCI
jgi:hypothetical protein